MTSSAPKKTFLGTLRDLLAQLVPVLLRWLGFRLLSRSETYSFLAKYVVSGQAGNQLKLRNVYDALEPDKLIFAETVATSETSFVWDYHCPNSKAVVLPLGSVRTQGRVLCTDFDDLRGVVKAALFPTRRKTVRAKVLIAPWSHQLDGVRYGGYYDFMMLVGAKLCRIRETIPAQVLANAVVAYPLFNTSYERELLTLLGFRPDQIIDSRHTEVIADRCILANNGDWSYPNSASIQALKNGVEKAVSANVQQPERIYIRRAGRRRVSNEAELIALLNDYQFTIINDEPRTIAEQVAIYSNASFILGPHGASFTNLIWCKPGTALFELFSPKYVVDYFLYLSAWAGLRYAATYSGALDDDRDLEADVHVSIPALRAALDQLFEPAY